MELVNIERGGLLLNAFPVSFSSDSFTGYEVTDDQNSLDELRKKHDGWYFRGGESITALPTSKEAENNFGGEEKTLRVNRSLGLLSSVVLYKLPSLFEDRKPVRRRPLVFTSPENLISKFESGWELPEILIDGFEVKRSFIFDTRIVNPFGDSPFVAVTAQVSSKWSIPAALTNLEEAGINLKGLSVLRRDPNPDEPRLVGTIKKIERGKVILAERFESAPDRIDVQDLCLNPSKESFKRCLSVLLGERYDSFESALRKRIDRRRKGPSLHRYFSQLRSYFEDENLSLTPGLEAEISTPVELGAGDTKNVHKAGEIEYCFNPSRTKRHSVPWFGLDQYGPFDRESFASKEPQILVVCLGRSEGRAEQFVTKLRDGVALDSDYQSSYGKGFDSVFGTHNMSFDWCVVDDDRRYQKSPGEAFSSAIRNHFQSLSKRPSEAYNAALVVVEEEHAFLAGPDNPYLQSKAECLMSGVPTQQVRTKTLRQDDYSLQYTLQNLSTALYAKMGGVPWTVDQGSGVAHELVIGLGTAEIQESRFQDSKRLIGITTVFRGDGSYLLSDLSQKCSYEDYPRVLERTTKRVLRDRRRKDGWQKGDKVRIVFHVFKRLKDVEMERITAECAAEIGGEQEIEFAFLNISSGHPYVMLDPHQEGDHSRSSEPKGENMPKAGTIVRISGRKRLVQTLGPEGVPHSDIPLIAPLLVSIYNKRKAEGVKYFDDLTYLAEQVYKFTGLSWKTVRPVKSPVTMEYSELIARQLGRLESIPDWSPRALDSLLPTSKWFL